MATQNVSTDVTRSQYNSVYVTSPSKVSWLLRIAISWYNLLWEYIISVSLGPIINKSIEITERLSQIRSNERRINAVVIKVKLVDPYNSDCIIYFS